MKTLLIDLPGHCVQAAQRGRKKERGRESEWGYVTCVKVRVVSTWSSFAWKVVFHIFGCGATTTSTTPLSLIWVVPRKGKTSNLPSYIFFLSWCIPNLSISLFVYYLCLHATLYLSPAYLSIYPSLSHSIFCLTSHGHFISFSASLFLFPDWHFMVAKFVLNDHHMCDHRSFSLQENIRPLLNFLLKLQQASNWGVSYIVCNCSAFKRSVPFPHRNNLARMASR